MGRFWKRYPKRDCYCCRLKRPLPFCPKCGHYMEYRNIPYGNLRYYYNKPIEFICYRCYDRKRYADAIKMGMRFRPGWSLQQHRSIQQRNAVDSHRWICHWTHVVNVWRKNFWLNKNKIKRNLPTNVVFLTNFWLNFSEDISIYFSASVSLYSSLILWLWFNASVIFHSAN